MSICVDLNDILNTYWQNASSHTIISEAQFMYHRNV